ncbi:type IV secretory system conjugative DNA transfer family protein, partial [Enterococcus faecium]|uniref:type IV secretory system conjugative DNA transfer family protein n=1 Tax=Enterococcus faecium TaxID=1352 RepID=UPI003F522997
MPDLFSKTAGFRKMAGHEIYYFNPDDMRSVRINPISHIRTYSQAADVASLIIKNVLYQQFWWARRRYVILVVRT